MLGLGIHKLNMISFLKERVRANPDHNAVQFVLSRDVNGNFCKDKTVQ